MGSPDKREAGPRQGDRLSDRTHNGANDYTAHGRVIAALHAYGCKVSRGRSQCPAHGSRGLTLAIRQTSTGAVIHCHAGCTPAEVVESIGLTLRDLFDSELPTGYTPPKRREASPWDVVTHGPGWQHLLDRIDRENALQADPGLRERARAHGDDCPSCRTDDLEPATPGAETWIRCTRCGHTAAVSQGVLDGARVVPLSCVCGGDLR